MFLALCAAHGLTRPEVNVHVEGHEVRLLVARPRLVVEIDGAAAHGTRPRLRSATAPATRS